MGKTPHWCWGLAVTLAVQVYRYKTRISPRPSERIKSGLSPTHLFRHPAGTSTALTQRRNKIACKPYSTTNLQLFEIPLVRHLNPPWLGTCRNSPGATIVGFAGDNGNDTIQVPDEHLLCIRIFQIGGTEDTAEEMKR